MESSNSDNDIVIVHPNREGAEAKATKAAVILLLVASAVITAIITIGGWSKLEGAQLWAIFYVVIYLVMAYMVNQWKRGILPVAAALAILLAVIALVAAPGWFDRDKTGFVDPALPASLLGLLTAILVPLQVLLIAFSMRAFSQKWNIEVEVTREEAEKRYSRGAGPRHPAAAQ
ncbi:MAG TPA: hypothetical protein VH300_06315 [Thermoleophilaceae bacterium]|nr:hypothetical protein [Thermoleophilaceae bacterium]